MNRSIKQLFNENDFQKFLKRYENTSFDSEKKTLIETTLKQSLFTSQQAKLILSKTTFDSKKKELFYQLYNNLVDPQNFEELLDGISSSITKKEIRNNIQSLPVPNNNYNHNNNSNNYNHTNEYNNYNNNNFNNNFMSNRQILDKAAFEKNFSKFGSESFFSSQAPILENMVKFYFLTCHQAKQFIDTLSFGKDKVKAFEILYPYLTDALNYEDILDSWTFDSDKKQARKLIGTLPSYYA